jgi:hypothetical protein
MANEEKLERFSPQWNAALQRCVEAGKKLLADNNDRVALAETLRVWQEAGLDCSD